MSIGCNRHSYDCLKWNIEDLRLNTRPECEATATSDLNFFLFFFHKKRLENCLVNDSLCQKVMFGVCYNCRKIKEQ